jgi:hypothetical protein
LATKSAPTVVPAPGLLSITTGWPRLFASASPSARATRSVVPPGGNGTTIVTGFEGQSCWASARPHAQAKAAPKPSATRRRRVIEVGCMSCLRVVPNAVGRSCDASAGSAAFQAA